MLPFLKSISANPGNPIERAVFADYCDENGLDRWEAFGFPFPLKATDVYSFGILEEGSGSGTGRGIGGGKGIGLGLGGVGRGSGSGSGIGLGGGSGNHNQGKLFMEPGKAYIVHCGDWHTIVGRCVRMVSPVVYVMDGCSKISDTGGGDNWHLLAANAKGTRDKATYLHIKGEVVVPLAIFAMPWEGATPAEESKVSN